MRPALSVAALVPVVAVVACGSDTAISEGDPRYPSIAGLIATTVENYASAGPDGLYSYLTPQVRLKCSQEQFSDTVGRRSDIGQLLRIDKVSVDGDVVRVKLRLSTGSGEREVEWKLGRQPNGNWAVLEVPGSEDCTP